MPLFVFLIIDLLIRVNFVLLELQIKQVQGNASGKKEKLFHNRRAQPQTRILWAYGLQLNPALFSFT